jgi:recombination protein RecA
MTSALLQMGEIAPSLRKIAGLSTGRPGFTTGGPASPTLALRLGDIDDALPDGGLPRGAVVEVASPYGLGKASSIALAACAAAQAAAKLRGGEGTPGAWCAWLELTPPGPAGSAHQTTLFAPAVARAGVDLARLLVIRPTAGDLARVAARAAQSLVFAAIVVDLAGVPGFRVDARLDRWVNPVRRLAMAIEGTETTVILLTDVLAPRALPLPVAMRIELERPKVDRLRLSIAKERRGRVANAVPVALPSSTRGEEPRHAARRSVA